MVSEAQRIYVSSLQEVRKAQIFPRMESEALLDDAAVRRRLFQRGICLMGSGFWFQRECLDSNDLKVICGEFQFMNQNPPNSLVETYRSKLLPLKSLRMGDTGLEPVTSCVSSMRSSQLS